MRLMYEITRELKSHIKYYQAFIDTKKSSNFFANALEDIGKIAAGIGLYRLVNNVFSYIKTYNSSWN